MKGFHSLLAGFQNFKNEYYLEDTEFYSALKHGQNPHCLLIACCDSRVDPALLFKCKPGEIFVVRNVAALVPAANDISGPDAVLAAAEYAVKHLKVKHIIVMGHSNCGGIAGLLKSEAIKEEKHLCSWLSIATPTLKRLSNLTNDEGPKLRCRHCEEGAILLSINNLLSYDWIRERVDQKKLELHALYFDLGEGNLHRYNPETEDFEILSIKD